MDSEDVLSLFFIPTYIILTYICKICVYTVTHTGNKFQGPLTLRQLSWPPTMLCTMHMYIDTDILCAYTYT